MILDLPHTLSDMRATFHVDNGGYSIDDFAAPQRPGNVANGVSASRLRTDEPDDAFGRGASIGFGPRAARHSSANRCKINGTSIDRSAKSMPTFRFLLTARRGGPR